MLSIDRINALTFTTTMTKCKGCTNQCRLTINRFSGGRQFISGNRCERGIGKERNKDHVPKTSSSSPMNRSRRTRRHAASSVSRVY